MTSILTCDLADARAAWLAGDPDAWTQYTACLRTLDARLTERDRPRQPRRPRRLLRHRGHRAQA